jgi:hypothetical protein
MGFINPTPETPRQPLPRCLDCGREYPHPPPGWFCQVCTGSISIHAGTIHVPSPSGPLKEESWVGDVEPSWEEETDD